MSFFEIALVLLWVAVLVVGLATRLNLPIELVLLISSIILAQIPGLPIVTLNPDLVFLVFLPPILFGAAYFTSWRDFKRNLRPISLLAVGLVLFTAIGVAFVVNTFIPSLSWAQGFLLGAILAPPDASAATAITKKLGVPRRILTILEGESLVNDATALVIYKFALAAILTGTFSFWTASFKFVTVGVGGALVGAALAFFALRIMERLRDIQAQVILSVVTAFTCYAVAEHLSVSGVISTVVGGLYFGRKVPERGSADLQFEAQSFWNGLLFTINGFVFTLIGLQLPSIFSALAPYSFFELVGYASLAIAAVVIIRLVWIFPATYLPRVLIPGLAKRDPSPSPKYILILWWAAMRGIVSLAAALALPEGLPNRELILFLTYVVILFTLIVPSLTLPKLMRLLKISAGGEHIREESLARLEMTRSGADLLSTKSKTTVPALVEELKKKYARRLSSLEANLSDIGFSPVNLEDQATRRLMLDVIRSEREALHRVRKNNLIHDEIFHVLARELDLEEMRMKTQRI